MKAQSWQKCSGGKFGKLPTNRSKGYNDSKKSKRIAVKVNKLEICQRIFIKDISRYAQWDDNFPSILNQQYVFEKI